jgi:hypothetical protein
MIPKAMTWPINWDFLFKTIDKNKKHETFWIPQNVGRALNGSFGKRGLSGNPKAWECICSRQLCVGTS